MSPEAQRIAIAEACGWKQCRPEPGHFPPTWKDRGTYYTSYTEMPDYLNDLNAMHRAEKVLTDEQFDRYISDLWNIVAPGETFDRSTPMRFLRALISATAAQRAEAFPKSEGAS